MKTVLVTGAGGYIGVPLCEELLEMGYRVKGLDRYYFGLEKVEHLSDNPRFEVVVDDIRFVDSRELRGVDCIIDLAGLSNDATAEIDPQLTIDINRDGAIRLANLARVNGVKRYVYSSSASVYGHGTKDLLSEEDALRPQTEYARSKAAVEAHILPLSDAGFEVVVLRNATVYGVAPRMRFDLAVNVMTMRAWKDHLIYVMGGGHQWRPFVHVRDVVQAMILALEGDSERVGGQIYNVGDETQNIQIRQLAQMVYNAVPNSAIHEIPDDADKRTYHLSFKKIHAELPFAITRRVRDGIEEVREGLETRAIDPADPTTHTLNWYRNLLDWEKRITHLTYNGSVMDYRRTHEARPMVA